MKMMEHAAARGSTQSRRPHQPRWIDLLAAGSGAATLTSEIVVPFCSQGVVPGPATVAAAHCLRGARRCRRSRSTHLAGYSRRSQVLSGRSPIRRRSMPAAAMSADPRSAPRCRSRIR